MEGVADMELSSYSGQPDSANDLPLSMFLRPTSKLTDQCGKISVVVVVIVIVGRKWLSELYSQTFLFARGKRANENKNWDKGTRGSLEETHLSHPFWWGRVPWHIMRALDLPHSSAREE